MESVMRVVVQDLNNVKEIIVGLLQNAVKGCYSMEPLKLKGNQTEVILKFAGDCGGDWKDAYETDEQWKEFKEIVELETMEPTDISTLTDAIYSNALSARVGATATMEINLKNSEDATAYVFDLVLPDGITVAKNESGKYIDALSDRHDDHSRTFNYKGGNTYSLSTLSGNSELLTGNDGAIRIVTLSVADDLPVGTYTIDIKNASYSLPDGSLVELPDTKAIIIVEDYVMGDVNDNGKVDIGDAVSIVNYLVGKESTNFVEKAADTNKNGKVDIGDAEDHGMRFY